MAYGLLELERDLKRVESMGLSRAAVAPARAPRRRRAPARPSYGRAYGTVEALSDLTDQAVTADNLANNFAGGVTVALWHTRDNYLGTRSGEWARDEDAVGPARAVTPAAENLRYGKSTRGDKKLHEILKPLSGALASIAGGGTAAVTPPASSLVRILGLFTHGTTTWMGVGGGIEISNVAAEVSAAAATLADYVNVIIYGCSSARGAAEAGDWYRTTMTDGGTGSLASAFRDALVVAGKSNGCVWGHTEVGHTTSNFTLREFRAADGKGAAGRSFVKHYVFDWETTGVSDLRAEVLAAGFTIPAAKEAKFTREASDAMRLALYRVWGAANKDLQHNKRNLAEVAPIQPTAVAALVQGRWTEHWNAKKTDIARAVAKAAKL
jgi:hypothetical protein